MIKIATLKNETKIEKDFVFYNSNAFSDTPANTAGNFEIVYQKNFIYDYKAETQNEQDYKLKSNLSILKKKTRNTDNHSKYFSSIDLKAIHQQTKKIYPAKSGYDICGCGKFWFVYRFIDRKE